MVDSLVLLNNINKTISKNRILTEGIQNINLTDILYAKKFGYKIKKLYSMSDGVTAEIEIYKLFVEN